jgi:hypothetical protein
VLVGNGAVVDFPVGEFVGEFVGELVGEFVLPGAGVPSMELSATRAPPPEHALQRARAATASE